jgi:hypothetical protein
LPTKGFDLARTAYAWNTDDQLDNGNDDRIAVLGQPGESSIPSSIEAIEGSLTIVRLLWSILTGRLLHVLTAVRVTGFGCRPRH